MTWVIFDTRAIGGNIGPTARPLRVQRESGSFLTPHRGSGGAASSLTNSAKRAIRFEGAPPGWVIFDLTLWAQSYVMAVFGSIQRVARVLLWVGSTQKDQPNMDQ